MSDRLTDNAHFSKESRQKSLRETSLKIHQCISYILRILFGPTCHEFIGESNKREEPFSRIFNNKNHYIWLWNFSLLGFVLLISFEYQHNLCPEGTSRAFHGVKSCQTLVKCECSKLGGWSLVAVMENCPEIGNFIPRMVLIKMTL